MNPERTIEQVCKVTTKSPDVACTQHFFFPQTCENLQQQILSCVRTSNAYECFLSFSKNMELHERIKKEKTTRIISST